MSQVKVNKDVMNTISTGCMRLLKQSSRLCLEKPHLKLCRLSQVSSVHCTDGARLV